MKVIECGSDLWRNVKCQACRSVLGIENDDVQVERYWDGEDGCCDSRVYVVCVACSARISIDAPSMVVERRLREQEVSDLEKLGSETVAAGYELSIDKNECGWNINVMDRKKSECLGHGHGDRIADALIDLAKERKKKHAAS